MRIQHNIAALNSYRQLGTNNNNVSKNLEKLSSGYRINRAGDDAAGLAISEKMRAQIKGLETAQKNANDGISLVQTAEGNLTEVHSMLNRMVELATQSANGTYDNAVDRANLQKEIVSLNSEIDRIAKSANFNGIKLLNGDINKAGGIDAGSLVTGAAVKSGSIGTLGTITNGTLTEGSAETKFSTSFYVGDITNSDAGTKNIVFTYKDNAGANQTVTLAVAGKKTVTTDDIVAALTGATKAGAVVGDITATDSGTAATGATPAGQFNELYDVTTNGNIVTITAKFENGETIPGSTNGPAIGGNFGVTGVTNTFVAADVTASTNALKEKYDGTTTNNIGYGTVAGTATAYKAKVDGNYQVASLKLTMTGNATDLHNTSIKVGDKTYVIKKDGEELKGTDGTETVVNVTAAATATDIATLLAAKITEEESSNGGFVASNAGGVVTISESTRRGQEILDASSTTSPKPATRGAAIASKVEFTLSAGTTTGTLGIDSTKLSNGTTVSVGNKKYMLSNDPTTTAPAGTTVVNYAKDATDAEISQALADAMTADGLTGVASGANGVSFAGTEGAVSVIGAGLTLQVGDTNESFQKVSVQIGDMSTTALDLNAIDISTQEGAGQAIDKIKAAINTVSSTRGDLGALQNRLDHTINNLGVTTENMTAAESRIRDVDMAKEMMDFTKNNILVQASQAMLAQANQIPQGVLQLLQ